MLYIISWTTKSGCRVENQLYTAGHIDNKLKQLEEDGCTNIIIRSQDAEEVGK